MPINFPQFQSGQVPRAPLAQPQQAPGVLDPANVIMEAARLKQQRDLAHAQMNQKAVEDLTSAIQTAQSLQEQKREALSKENIAQAMLQLQQGKVPFEEAELMGKIGLMGSQQKIADAQASFLSGSGANGDMEDVHNGKKDYNQWITQFSTRSGITQSMAAGKYHELYPNDSPTDLHLKYLKLQGIQGEQIAQYPSVARIDKYFPEISRFDKLASMVPMTSSVLLNKYGLQAAATNNGGIVDPVTQMHANNLLQQATILQEQGRQLGGAGSDQAGQLANQMFSPHFDLQSTLSKNQIARESLRSTRNKLNGDPNDYFPPEYSMTPSAEPVSSYLKRIKNQNIPANQVMGAVHGMVQSGLLTDDISQ